MLESVCCVMPSYAANKIQAKYDAAYIMKVCNKLIECHFALWIKIVETRAVATSVTPNAVCMMGLSGEMATISRQNNANSTAMTRTVLIAIST